MDSNIEIIKKFLKPPPEGAYTDEKLAALLAHAEDGKLTHHSCCCLAGIPTADHALRGRDELGNPMSWTHGAYQPETAVKKTASLAFNFLAGDDVMGSAERDADRRAKLIPLIREEMKRRESLRTQTEVSEVVMA